MADDILENVSVDAMRRSELASWVTQEVENAREDWEREWQDRFDDYYRLWRGLLSPDINGRKSERSKLIHPQLMAAVDSTHAEIVSATAHQRTYFQLDDTGPQSPAVAEIQKALMEDFDKAHIRKSLISLTLVGTIFGTGIGRINLDSFDEISPEPDMLTGELKLRRVSRPLVKIRSLLPHEFVIDSSATSIAEAKFVATYEDTPRHLVIAKQRKGVYADVEISHDVPEEQISGAEETDQRGTNNVHIIEYHGLVPRKLLDGSDIELVVDLEDESAEPVLEDIDEDDLVEAFVVVANKTTVLMAKENPLVNKDRLFLAYRHEEIPGQFWGRGVAEKGYMSQKALDSNLRARQDALALTVHPMYEVDMSKGLPRNFKFEIEPGRSIPTIGNGAINKIDMGQLSPEQFNNTSELQQMVQVATGAVDQTPQNSAGAQNGFNIQALNFVKRSQIAIANFSEEFMVPFVELASRLYMQFMPERYPATDVTFKASAALGALAKEMEQAQLINLLKTMQGGPAQLAILHEVVLNSSVQGKDQVAAIIRQQLEASMQPPQPDPMIILKQQEIQAKILAEQARRVTEFERVQAEKLRALNDAVRADSDEAQKISQSILNLAKADSEASSRSIQEYNQLIQAIAQEQQVNNSALLSNDTINRTQNVGTPDIIGLLQGSGVETPQ